MLARRVVTTELAEASSTLNGARRPLEGNERTAEAISFDVMRTSLLKAGPRRGR